MFQITFKPIEDFESRKGEIINLFKQKYPRYKDHNSGAIELTFSDGVVPIQQVSKNINLIEFKTDDGKTSISLGSSTYTYTANVKSYRGFEDLIDNQAEIFSFFSLFNVTDIESIGIRKINIMEFRKDSSLDIPTSLPPIFSDNLCSHYSYFPNPSMINNAIQTLRYENETHDLTFVYGLNIPFGGSFETMQGIIDINIRKKSLTKIDDIKIESSKMNREMFNIFMWAMNENIINAIS